MTPCPKCGGLSTDAEFCSECGASLGQPPVTPAITPGGTAIRDTPDTCPVCGEPRPGPAARYCDNCRYDFATRQSFNAAPPVAAPAPLPIAHPAAPPPTPLPPPLDQWDLHAATDLSLRRPEDPMPADSRPRIFPLDLADHLIGRRSDREDIHPEITIDDPGISRRHARILRTPEGTLTLLDLGSMNGTRLDGTRVEPNVPTALVEGSEVTLGCWTRLVVRPR